jgi:hypothetical protein
VSFAAVWVALDAWGILRAIGAPAGEDVTRREDYEAESGEEGVEELPSTPAERVPVGSAR